MTVRRARHDDGLTMWQLTKELGYSSNEADFGERLCHALRQPSSMVAVAEKGSLGLLGWVQATPRETLQADSCAELTGLVVASQARRMGVGRRLVAEVEKWAQEMGLHTVVVRSNTQRVESHEFYKALGYDWTKSQHKYQRKLIGPRSGDSDNLSELERRN